MSCLQSWRGRCWRLPGLAICERSAALANVRGRRSRASEQNISISIEDWRYQFAYLSTNDLPLVLLPVLVGQLESLHVLILPDAKLLAQSLVPHLQCCNLEGLAFLSLESGGDVLPREVLIFFELNEEPIILAQVCRGNRRRPLPALGGTARRILWFLFVPPSLLNGLWVGSNVRIWSSGLRLSDLWRA